MRLKQAKFRGRKKTDKQGAKNYIQNNYILHSFYHLINPLIGERKQQMQLVKSKKSRSCAGQTTLTVLQPQRSAGHMPWPCSLSANPAVTQMPGLGKHPAYWQLKYKHHKQAVSLWSELESVFPKKNNFALNVGSL